MKDADDDNDESARQIDAVRRFNRFYSRRIGLLRQSYLDSRSGRALVGETWELKL